MLHDVHNPLYNAVMYGWIRSFGDSEVSIRMPSMIAGYAMIWVLWRWARERFGGRVAGIAAAWLLISPVPVWYFAEAKNSIFTALFGTLVLVAHDRMVADEEKQWGKVGACVAASVFAVLTDFQTLLVIAPVWIAVALTGWRERRRGGIGRGWGSGCSSAMMGTVVVLLPLVISGKAAPRRRNWARDYLGLFNLKVDAVVLVLVDADRDGVTPTRGGVVARRGGGGDGSGFAAADGGWGFGPPRRSALRAAGGVGVCVSPWVLSGGVGGAARDGGPAAPVPGPEHHRAAAVVPGGDRGGD